jgi:hypothetical protein
MFCRVNEVSAGTVTDTNCRDTVLDSWNALRKALVYRARFGVHFSASSQLEPALLDQFLRCPLVLRYFTHVSCRFCRIAAATALQPLLEQGKKYFYLQHESARCSSNLPVTPSAQPHAGEIQQRRDYSTGNKKGKCVRNPAASRLPVVGPVFVKLEVSSPGCSTGTGTSICPANQVGDFGSSPRTRHTGIEATAPRCFTSTGTGYLSCE